MRFLCSMTTNTITFTEVSRSATKTYDSEDKISVEHVYRKNEYLVSDKYLDVIVSRESPNADAFFTEHTRIRYRD